MRNPSKKDIIAVFNNLIENCDGAIMAARDGDYLHNFAFLLQEKLRVLEQDFIYYSQDDAEDSTDEN